MKNKIWLKIRKLIILPFDLIMGLVSLPLTLIFWFFNDKTLIDSFKIMFDLPTKDDEEEFFGKEGSGKGKIARDMVDYFIKQSKSCKKYTPVVWDEKKRRGLK